MIHAIRQENGKIRSLCSQKKPAQHTTYLEHVNCWKCLMIAGKNDILAQMERFVNISEDRKIVIGYMSALETIQVFIEKTRSEVNGIRENNSQQNNGHAKEED